MPLPPDCPLLEETTGSSIALRLNAARLSDSDIEPLRARLFEVVTRHPTRDVRLDLAQLEYVSSTGLALLVALHKRVLAGGGYLTLANVRRSLYDLLALTRLNAILDVRRMPSDDEARAAASA
jgi:anti-anti-sigma factor